MARHLHLYLPSRMPRVLVEQDVPTARGVDNTERARIEALTALREGGLRWPVVYTKHNQQHDEQ